MQSFIHYCDSFLTVTQYLVCFDLSSRLSYSNKEGPTLLQLKSLNMFKSEHLFSLWLMCKKHVLQMQEICKSARTKGSAAPPVALGPGVDIRDPGVVWLWFFFFFLSIFLCFLSRYSFNSQQGYEEENTSESLKNCCLKRKPKLSLKLAMCRC